MERDIRHKFVKSHNLSQEVTMDPDTDLILDNHQAEVSATLMYVIEGVVLGIVSCLGVTGTCWKYLQHYWDINSAHPVTQGLPPTQKSGHRDVVSYKVKVGPWGTQIWDGKICHR